MIERRQTHINELIREYRITENGKIPPWRISTHKYSYPVNLVRVGFVVGPWQIDHPEIEKRVGAVVWGYNHAHAELMTDESWSWFGLHLRWVIVRAVRKHHNGAAFNGRPLNPWLPYGEKHPLWTLAQMDPQPNPANRRQYGYINQKWDDNAILTWIDAHYPFDPTQPFPQKVLEEVTGDKRTRRKRAGIRELNKVLGKKVSV